MSLAFKLMGTNCAINLSKKSSTNLMKADVLIFCK